MNVTLRHHTALSLLCGVLLLLASSCHHDGPAPAPTEDNAQVRLVLRVPASPQDGFEVGSSYENHIDVLNGDYRICFFDAEGKYMTRLKPSSILYPVDVATEDYTVYHIKGNISRSLVNNKTFKVVVLANWKNYNAIDAALDNKTITTIYELCTHPNAQYSYEPPTGGFFPQKDNNHRIPFFGVQTFSGITFEPEKETPLEDVWLLRAMAKVEVILENEAGSLAEVKIIGYNTKGYCAPEWNKSEWKSTDLTWWEEKSLIVPVHLVNGQNDADTKSTSFIPDTYKKKWVIYLPEYKNIGVTNQSSISVTIQREDGQNLLKEIYFTDYTGQNPAEVKASTWDIKRNTIYRFKIHVKSEVEVNTSIIPWAEGKGEVTIDVSPGLDVEVVTNGTDSSESQGGAGG